MSPKEFEALLSDAGVQLTRLKHLYDQWFQGIERAEPLIPKKQFDRSLAMLRKNQPRNTVLRFKTQQLVQRYTAMQTYWRRVGRQIEEGTYRRDLMKARRRREAARVERKSARPAADDAVTIDPEQNLDLNKIVKEAEKSVESRKRRAGKVAPPPPPPSRAKGPGDARMRQIFDAYVEAKRANNESLDKVSYESVVKSINKVVPKIKRTHKGREVDFKIVKKDGKVGLKPYVKK